jgi:hypothetical protein
MTSAGWMVMAFSVGTVTILFLWCVYKVLTAPEQTENVHRRELHTPDMEEPD